MWISIFFSALLLAAAAAPGYAAIRVATVGDSLADAIYLGMKFQPDLLKKSGIQVLRWSRSKIGLTRTDYFDYTTWLRDTEELGSADFCIVQLGANDLQSIGADNHRWIGLGTDAWQHTYEKRVRMLVQTLKTRRCGSVVWLLQPAYQRNKFLSQYHAMINALQLAGSASGAAAAFDIATEESDYGADGIHFNREFCLKLGRAVASLLASGNSAATEQLLPLLLRRAAQGDATPLRR